ncbi:hypothetical protein PspLS_10293 [Pyricularia sp. CBS 133598]|nr:hypothetical protein PspLS_10293 [Pyricularia sp. CBS 133598]
MDTCYICGVPFWAEVSDSPQTVSVPMGQTNFPIRQFDSKYINADEVAWLRDKHVFEMRLWDSGANRCSIDRVDPDNLNNLQGPLLFVHWSCYEVLAGALTGRIGDTSSVHLDTLAEAWCYLTADFSKKIDHTVENLSKHAEFLGFFCTSSDCDRGDVRAADPRPSEQLTLNLRRALEQISHELVMEEPKICYPNYPSDGDVFAKLNLDMLWLLSPSLTSKDLLALCSASPSIRRATATCPGFWAARIHHEFPWFVEAREILRDDSIQPPYHPRWLYTAILHETKPRCDVTGPWMPIANRRYIWQRQSGEVARLYRKFKRPESLCKTKSDHAANREHVEKSIHRSAICQYRARVCFPVPIAPQSTEPPSTIVKRIFWVKEWSQTYRMPAGFEVVRTSIGPPNPLSRPRFTPSIRASQAAGITEWYIRIRTRPSTNEPLQWPTGITLDSAPIGLEHIRRLWDNENGGILPEHASVGRHCQTIYNVTQRRLWRSSYRWRLGTPIWSTPGVHMHEIIERQDMRDPRQFPLDMVPHYALMWDPHGTKAQNLKSVVAETIYCPGCDLDGTIVDLKFECSSRRLGKGRKTWSARDVWWRSTDPKPASSQYREKIKGKEGERIIGLNVVLGPKGSTRGIEFVTNQNENHSYSGFYVGRPRLDDGETMRHLRAPDGEKAIGLVVTFENNIRGQPDIMALSSVGLLTREVEQTDEDLDAEKEKVGNGEPES